jgi:hypothetical protein
MYLEAIMRRNPHQGYISGNTVKEQLTYPRPESHTKSKLSPHD